MDIYYYLPYSESYPKLYQEEKKRLCRYVGAKAVIEHFGSTAVPNLGGKGIIDIYLMTSEQEFDTMSKRIQEAGYIWKDIIIPNITQKHRFYVRETNSTVGIKVKYNLHQGFFGEKNFDEVLAFRDYLRTHPMAAREYDQIKQAAVRETHKYSDHDDKRNAYRKVKEPFLKKWQNTTNHQDKI